MIHINAIVKKLMLNYNHINSIYYWLYINSENKMISNKVQNYKIIFNILKEYLIIKNSVYSKYFQEYFILFMN